MSKKIISFVVLFLILLNIPSVLLETQSIALSSPVSYFTFFLFVYDSTKYAFSNFNA